MRIRFYFFNYTCHIERTEIIHDPTIANVDFLEVEITVVGIKMKDRVLFCLFVRVALDEV